MISKVWDWVDKPRTVYTNNLSYLIGELCFWYVVIDICMKVWG